ncbi:MAG: hypothetical protein IPM02_13520 [Betaproteobacteria bacterium]|nr:hypothetical protein [Betaproteobacteria bacterium]
MLTLYYGSGSPYAWRVNLALEHKALPYERRVLSFAKGDLKKPRISGAQSAGKGAARGGGGARFPAMRGRHPAPRIVG